MNWVVDGGQNRFAYSESGSANAGATACEDPQPEPADAATSDFKLSQIWATGISRTNFQANRIYEDGGIQYSSQIEIKFGGLPNNAFSYSNPKSSIGTASWTQTFKKVGKVAQPPTITTASKTFELAFIGVSNKEENAKTTYTPGYAETHLPPEWPMFLETKEYKPAQFSYKQRTDLNFKVNWIPFYGLTPQIHCVLPVTGFKYPLTPQGAWPPHQRKLNRHIGTSSSKGYAIRAYNATWTKQKTTAVKFQFAVSGGETGSTATNCVAYTIPDPGGSACTDIIGVNVEGGSASSQANYQKGFSATVAGFSQSCIATKKTSFCNILMQDAVCNSMFATKIQYPPVIWTIAAGIECAAGPGAVELIMNKTEAKGQDLTISEIAPPGGLGLGFSASRESVVGNAYAYGGTIGNSTSALPPLVAVSWCPIDRVGFSSPFIHTFTRTFDAMGAKLGPPFAHTVKTTFCNKKGIEDTSLVKSTTFATWWLSKAPPITVSSSTKFGTSVKTFIITKDAKTLKLFAPAWLTTTKADKADETTFVLTTSYSEIKILGSVETTKIPAAVGLPSRAGTMMLGPLGPNDTGRRSVSYTLEPNNITDTATSNKPAAGCLILAELGKTGNDTKTFAPKLSIIEKRVTSKISMNFSHLLDASLTKMESGGTGSYVIGGLANELVAGYASWLSFNFPKYLPFSSGGSWQLYSAPGDFDYPHDIGFMPKIVYDSGTFGPPWAEPADPPTSTTYKQTACSDQS